MPHRSCCWRVAPGDLPDFAAEQSDPDRVADVQAVEGGVFDTTRFVGEVGRTIITGWAAIEVGDFCYLPDVENRLGREHISDSVVVIRGGL